jgi:uncharacterized protein
MTTSPPHTATSTRVAKRVFLDTSGWLAAVNPRDTLHKVAVEAYQELLEARASFVTSNLVIAEMHALVVREQGTKAGVGLLDAIYSDPLYRVVHVDRDLESQAVDTWLRKFTDARFSLTDAASFQIMRTEGIDQALALDHHFEIAGFNVVPSKRKRR